MHMTGTTITEATPTRRVSTRLKIGVIFLPLVFAWFLLRRGYSSLARVLAFGWFGVGFLLFLLPHPQPSAANRQATASAPVADQPKPTSSAPNAMRKKDDGGDGGTAEEGSLIDDQVAAKYQLERILRDPSSAKYDAVRGYRYRTSDNKQGYNFCGTVNAKNGFGGYNGPQRFSANAAIAMIDDGSDGFQKIWDKYCTDAEGGQEIWF